MIKDLYSIALDFHKKLWRIKGRELSKSELSTFEKYYAKVSSESLNNLIEDKQERISRLEKDLSEVEPYVRPPKEVPFWQKPDYVPPPPRAPFKWEDYPELNKELNVGLVEDGAEVIEKHENGSLKLRFKEINWDMMKKHVVVDKEYDFHLCDYYKDFVLWSLDYYQDETYIKSGSQSSEVLFVWNGSNHFDFDIDS